MSTVGGGEQPHPRREAAPPLNISRDPGIESPKGCVSLKAGTRAQALPSQGATYLPLWLQAPSDVRRNEKRLLSAKEQTHFVIRISRCILDHVGSLIPIVRGQTKM